VSCFIRTFQFIGAYVSTQLDSYFCVIEERVLLEGYIKTLQLG
jgi:hypothetical protein